MRYHVLIMADDRAEPHYFASFDAHDDDQARRWSPRRGRARTTDSSCEKTAFGWCVCRTRAAAKKLLVTTSHQPRAVGLWVLLLHSLDGGFEVSPCRGDSVRVCLECLPRPAGEGLRRAAVNARGV